MSHRLPARLWRTAFSAGLASYLDAATLISVSISLPVWRARYVMGVWAVGSVTAGLAFAVAVGAVAGGWLGDHLGRGAVFTYDLAVFVAGIVLMLTAGSSAVLIVGVIVTGLAAGADVPTALAVISDCAPISARGRLTGLTQLMWIAAVLVTFGLGFAVSHLGFLGTKILVAHLLLLGCLTLVMRVLLARTAVVAGDPRPAVVVSPQGVWHRGLTQPLLATGAFFVCWNVASTTMGNYGTYYLVTVTGLTQTRATGLVLATFPLALVMAALFVRLADSRWRDRLFVVALVLQIAAFATGALTGGQAWWGMVLLIVLYSLSNVFAGEAIYRVWSQLLLPDDVRSTAIGVTYGVARATAAAMMFAVPALIDHGGVALLWVLCGCTTVSGLVGLLITRYPRFAAQLRPS